MAKILQDLIRFLVRVMKEMPAKCLQGILEPIQNHTYPPNVLKEILSAQLLEEQYMKRQISTRPFPFVRYTY